MDPVARAASLLSSAIDAGRARPLLTELGFTDNPVLLDGEIRQLIGLDAGIESAYVIPGAGALRALVLETSDDAPAREVIVRLAANLASKLPHLLWIPVVIHRKHRQFALACWHADRPRPRVVALVVDTERVVTSDAESICSMAAAVAANDVMTHARWIDLLGRESITRRFFSALGTTVSTMSNGASGGGKPDDRADLALLYICRLLFLAFIESKGWLNRDFAFLRNSFDSCVTHGGGFHTRVLRPLFFGTLNTRIEKRSARALSFGRIPFLNGGLFSRTPQESRLRECVFPDEAVSDVFSQLLNKYRFSPREDAIYWSETAIDPEILGKAFESLMAGDIRKAHGAFYTPQKLVEDITSSALIAVLSPVLGKSGSLSVINTGALPHQRERDEALALLRGLTCLDPACGSGAFLVHALERIAELRLRLGDLGTASSIRRTVLSGSVFGVDINPTAVWLCQLRLWLSVLIDSGETDPMRVKPLPNLDRQIRIGDSLAGRGFHANADPCRGKRLVRLRARYARASGSRKRNLANTLDREERRESVAALDAEKKRVRFERSELLLATRSRDLFGQRTGSGKRGDERLSILRARERSIRQQRTFLKNNGALPFSFDIHFADVEGRGGFDLVIGNPPWVRMDRITSRHRPMLKREFATFRAAEWSRGAIAAGLNGGGGFSGQVDVSALFIERSAHLLRRGGVAALLVPAKLWRSLAGGGVRRFLSDELQLVALEDLTCAKTGFDAAVYPSVLIGVRPAGGSPSPARRAEITVHRPASVIRWTDTAEHLGFDSTSGSPWLTIPSEVRAAFNSVAAAGLALTETGRFRPILGVKTGCNAAFLIRSLSSCRAMPGGGESQAPVLEREMLRPVIRGETMEPWRANRTGEQLIWPYEQSGNCVTLLPPNTRKWLAPWRPRLQARADANAASEWWSLFRTEGARNDVTRVVWCDFGKTPCAAILEVGDPTIPLNTCYITRCKDRVDALALCALLNSPLLAAWLNVLAEPARGGYRRYLGWTIAMMPLPLAWDDSKSRLAQVTERALKGDLPTPCELLDAALRAFKLGRPTVEPLLTWSASF